MKWCLMIALVAIGVAGCGGGGGGSSDPEYDRVPYSNFSEVWIEGPDHALADGVESVIVHAEMGDYEGKHLDASSFTDWRLKATPGSYVTCNRQQPENSTAIILKLTGNKAGVFNYFLEVLVGGIWYYVGEFQIRWEPAPDPPEPVGYLSITIK